jgi:c-di-GMP-binding flagellar brake protein YcgR
MLVQLNRCAFGWIKMRSERRKYVRFKAQENAFVALGTNFSRVGKLKEISIGGLAFEYIDSTKCSCQDFSRVAIFLSDSEFHLSKLPCRLICDREIYVINDNPLFESSCRINKCVVQFTDITENQKEKLETFIENHTRGIVPSSIDQMHNTAP